jgi:HPt (histidine-containing phosphotransfer) domain-containing protein
MPRDSILNPHAIQALRDLSPEGEGEFLKELVTIFLEDTPKQLAQLEEAVGRNDPSGVVRAAHTIKGSAGNFGAEEFADLARQIESAGKANEIATAAGFMPEFKLRFGKVSAALKELAGL